MSSKIAPLLVTLISTIVFFSNITSYPLRNWDEAWYGEIIKNMSTNSHSFLVPFWNGQYYFDKPPLYFWLSLPFFKIFGPGEWQARIVSATASVFACLLIYLIAKKLFGQKAGLFSALAFITLGQVVVRFASGNLDALLVLTIVASFYFYLLSQKSKRFALLCGISIGLATLTKGWLPAMYSFLTITVYEAILNKKLPANISYILLGSFTASFWYFIAGFLTFGKQFTNWYILQPDAGLARSPFSSFSLSYFRDLVRDIGFWWILIAIAILSKIRLKKDESLAITASIFSVILFILPLNFLSEKLGWYNLPAYPFAAIVIGLLTSKLHETSKKLASIFIIIIFFAQVANVTRIENIYPDRSTIGADLGKIAKKLIPVDDQIILDDRDFTSFLYYSNHQAVYVTLPNGGKDWEWWTLKYKNVEEFTNNHPKSWLITRNPNNFPTISGEIVVNHAGYDFIRL